MLIIYLIAGGPRIQSMLAVIGTNLKIFMFLVPCSSPASCCPSRERPKIKTYVILNKENKTQSNQDLKIKSEDFKIKRKYKTENKNKIKTRILEVKNYKILGKVIKILKHKNLAILMESSQWILDSERLLLKCNWLFVLELSHVGDFVLGHVALSRFFVHVEELVHGVSKCYVGEGGVVLWEVWRFVVDAGMWLMILYACRLILGCYRDKHSYGAIMTTCHIRVSLSRQYSSKHCNRKQIPSILYKCLGFH